MQRRKLPGISSLGLVADRNALEVDSLGQLLRHLGQDPRKGVRGLDGEAELTLFAHEPEDHDVTYFSAGLSGEGRADQESTAKEEVKGGRGGKVDAW